MTAVALGSVALTFDKEIDKIEFKMNAIREKCAEITARLDAVLSGLSGFYDGIIESVEDARATVNDMANVMARGIGIITGAADLTADALVSVSDAIFAIPQDIMGIMYNVADDCVNAVAHVLGAIDNIKEHFNAIGTEEYWFPESIKDKLQADNEEVNFLMRKLSGKLDNDQNDLYIASLDLNSEMCCYVENFAVEGGRSVKARNIENYGATDYQIKENDTLESICLSNYGALDYMENILLYNPLSDISELGAGILKLPRINPASRRIEGIISYNKERDNYGRDIRLDDDGNIMVKDNDFDVIGGVDNLTQAVLLRLRDSADRRLRLQAYGIKMNLGVGRAANTYIMSSIYETIMADRRVLRIDEITFRGVGSYLEVSVKFTDVNNAAVKFAQRV